MSASPRRRLRDAEAVSPFMVAMLGLVPCDPLRSARHHHFLVLQRLALRHASFRGHVEMVCGAVHDLEPAWPNAAVARNLGARRPQCRAVRHNGRGVARSSRLALRRRPVSHRTSQRHYRALADPRPGDAPRNERHRSRPQPRLDLSWVASDDAALCRLHRGRAAAVVGP